MLLSLSERNEWARWETAQKQQKSVFVARAIILSSSNVNV
jgi:hypothetical protein